MRRGITLASGRHRRMALLRRCIAHGSIKTRKISEESGVHETHAEGGGMAGEVDVSDRAQDC
jgi:hypothetical protein